MPLISGHSAMFRAIDLHKKSHYRIAPGLATSRQSGWNNSQLIAGHSGQPMLLKAISGCHFRTGQVRNLKSNKKQQKSTDGS